VLDSRKYTDLLVGVLAKGVIRVVAFRVVVSALDSSIVVFVIVGMIFSAVLHIAADGPEDWQAWCCCCVGVYIENICAFNLLEQSHGSVPGIVPDHVRVVLTLAHVETRVLEDAALAICTLGGVVEEILTYRGHVLLAEALLLLKFVLSMGKPAALLLVLVLAFEAIEPELAQLCLDLALPTVLSLGGHPLELSHLGCDAGIEVASLELLVV